MKIPPSHSGASRAVVETYSIAANLTGWLFAMNRAMMSPIITCSGAQIPAIVNGTAKPSRW